LRTPRMVDSGDSGGRRSSVSARPAPLLPPPPLRCGSPAADPALRRPLAGSARPSGGRARASPHRLVHHPRPARVALPARAASTSCSTAVAPRRRWRGSSPFSKAELVSSAQIGAPEASARAGFTATPRASGDPPATHSAPPSRPSAPLSSLREPRLPVQQSDPKGQAPFSTPSAAASRRLARDQEELASGVLRVPGSPSPPGPPPSRPLCARRKAPRKSSLRRRSQKRDDQRTIGGPKATVLTGGDPGKLRHPGFPVAWSRPPRLPRPSRVRASRAGEEHDHRDAPAVVLPEPLGRGSGLFWFLLSGFGRETGRVEGRGEGPGE
jgi:hypothetical protein